MLIFIPSLIIIYTVIALSKSLMSQVLSYPSRELFPFFNWSLFSTPRVHSELYTIRITKVRSDKAAAAALVDKTIRPQDLTPLKNARFQKTTRALGRAYRHKRPDQIEGLKKLAANFLRPKGVIGYDLIRLTYHPIEFYHDHRAADEKVIASIVIQP